MSFTIYSPPALPANERQRERAVCHSGAMIPHRGDEFHDILSVACSALRVHTALVTIIHEDCAHVIASSGFETGVYRRSTSICAHAILEPSGMLVLPDARLDDRFAGNPSVADPNGIRFYAAAALFAPGKLPLGTLCVFDQAPRAALTGKEASILRSLAAAVMDGLNGVH